jgi:hypothetical protein
LKIVNINTGEEIFVEVSALGFRKQQRQISNAERILHADLLDAMGVSNDIIMRASVYKELDEATLKDTMREIRQLAAKARTSGVLETWTVDGVIEIASASADLAETIYQWSVEREIPKGEIIGGAQIDLNDPKRLIYDKIGKEVRQLPKDRPGMIVVTTSQNFLFHTYPMAPIGAALSERVRRYSQLACVAVSYCHYVDKYRRSDRACLNRRLLCQRVGHRICLA